MPEGLTRQISGFSLVGVANTVIHLAVVTAAVEALAWHPVLANGLAFGVANTFSFWANSRFTFAAEPTRGRYARFVTVSLLGLLLSLLASALASIQGWHYLIGVAIAFVLLPGLSFLANRYWTWRDPTS